MADIGHNTPPDPLAAFSLHIDDLFEQAQQFLDGTAIESEAQAEDVSRILNMVRKAAKDADEARKAEKKPHDDAAKAVQTRWKPILEKADLAAETAKNALAAFLMKKEAAQRAAAEAARQEAARQAEAAAQAAAVVSNTDLAGLTTVRVLQENAAELTKKAERLDKKPIQARGGERAVSLRTSYRAEITDPVAFGKWLWEHRRADYLEWLEDVARRECRHGSRGIPGVQVHEERNKAA